MIDISAIQSSLKIEEISYAPLAYERPRTAGKNARLGVHGRGGTLPVVRARIGGLCGFGWCAVERERAESLIGLSTAELFGEDGSLKEEYYFMEFPLLDWLGQYKAMPVYKLFADVSGEYRVPVYDTSIYIDEPDGADDAEAVELLCGEVAQGMERGHRHFKVKVGRCGRWMETEAGIRRDIAVVNAIRGTMGPDGALMADANNGYNLNLAKRFLEGARGAGLYWLEEAFHEDDELYRDLKNWMSAYGMKTLIADGEGDASPRIVDWACGGIVDVIQFDLRHYGFHKWLTLSKRLDAAGVYSAPHNYGGYYGNFASAHIAGAIRNFAFGEWDEAAADGIDASAYAVRDGYVYVPDAPGFGLTLDNRAFDKAVKEKGWSLR